ncbi:uncharacterized protein LOC110247530 [Exaiptasia diaphana]|uniref:FP protein C-terminal domain-containing protein n=1 Tax=Exaiptasia diaphana TaxID=2652724 RepID=A0A913XV69_EXADI|nr:uncharacterized protein LOC110247530 [Exaiptasia diaphana]
MTTLQQVEDLIRKQLNPINVKLDDLSKKYDELQQAVKFISDKYDGTMNEIKSTNTKIQAHNRDLTTIKQDLKIIDKRAIESLDQVEELAQYIRRDCLEISGIKATDEPSSEAIVQAIGAAINTPLDYDDISIAHPIPSHNPRQPPKIIVKFKHRKTRNKFYINRRKLAGTKPKDIPGLDGSSTADNKIFISESLTPKKRRLFGEINKFKKHHKWKFIWTYNGRIYLKEKENTKQYAFDNDDDLQEFYKANETYDDYSYSWR